MVCIPRAALAQALESARIRKMRILPLSGVRETNRFRDQRDSWQIVHMASPTFRGGTAADDDIHFHDRVQRVR